MFKFKSEEEYERIRHKNFYGTLKFFIDLYTIQSYMLTPHQVELVSVVQRYYHGQTTKHELKRVMEIDRYCDIENVVYYRLLDAVKNTVHDFCKQYNLACSWRYPTGHYEQIGKGPRQDFIWNYSAPGSWLRMNKSAPDDCCDIILFYQRNNILSELSDLFTFINSYSDDWFEYERIYGKIIERINTSSEIN